MKKDAFIEKIPFIIFALLIVPAVIATVKIANTLNEDIVVEPSPEVETYHDDTIAVVKENTYITAPVLDPNASIGKRYYDYLGDEETQEKALVRQEDTYYQNTGIDYVKEDVFDVVSISEGSVILVKEDDLVGKVVQIEHKNGLISIYQSLGEVKVQKGDAVYQGQIIGTSGTNEMDKELGNHLHFEIYENGNSVNPENYINKDYKKEN